MFGYESVDGAEHQQLRKDRKLMLIIGSISPNILRIIIIENGPFGSSHRDDFGGVEKLS